MTDISPIPPVPGIAQATWDELSVGDQIVLWRAWHTANPEKIVDTNEKTPIQSPASYLT